MSIMMLHFFFRVCIDRW